MDLFQINSSWWCVDSFLGFQSWFRIFVMVLNSWQNSWTEIHIYAFMNMKNSKIRILTWCCNILYVHELNMILWHEFVYDFMSHDHQFMCCISWSMNSNMNSCLWRKLYKHIWIQRVPRFPRFSQMGECGQASTAAGRRTAGTTALTRLAGQQSCHWSTAQWVQLEVGWSAAEVGLPLPPMFSSGCTGC